MAYSTNAQVASEFKGITFSSSTPLTDTEVDRFIAEADEEINNGIGSRYSVPISSSTSPISTITVRQLSIWLTAHRVGQILQVKSVLEEVNQDGAVISLRLRAMEMIEKIRQGTIILQDAEVASTTNGVADFNTPNSIVPKFEQETENQW